LPITGKRPALVGTGRLDYYDLDFGLLGDFPSIIDFNTQAANCALINIFPLNGLDGRVHLPDA
jgi:hypothetical protein